MPGIKLNKPVRRNMTLDYFTAEKLENTSIMTGWAQGNIIEMAFSQPIMERLFAFTNPENDNPLTALIEAYQVSEGHMNPRTGEYILEPVRKWLKKHAVPKPVSKQTLDNLNDYVASHITAGGREASSFLKEVYDRAGESSFVVTGEEMRGRLLQYIDVMIAGRDDSYLMGESFNFRNIEHILYECFEVPSEPELTAFYREFSDGWVLPIIP